ncbi:MAG: mycofactocin precursor MftA [Streptosporangiaceae bacterium]|jgi:mycofactocin precursor
MHQDTRADASSPDASSANALRVGDDLGAGQEPEIAEELLVEEVSIDGMCGVY